MWEKYISTLIIHKYVYYSGLSFLVTKIKKLDLRTEFKPIMWL